MTLVYFDTSALLKLCVAERGSELATRLWDRADAVVTSRLADPELRAVLAAARRAGRLDRATAASAVSAWDRMSPALYVVEVSERVTASAAGLLRSHPLRAADAVHLASALLCSAGATVMAAWDDHLAAAARAEGLTVLP